MQEASENLMELREHFKEGTGSITDVLRSSASPVQWMCKIVDAIGGNTGCSGNNQFSNRSCYPFH